MRVVGGAWRGRSLQSPAGRNTRPTSDKVREAVFDVLGALPEAREAALAGAVGPGGRGSTGGPAGANDEAAAAAEAAGPLAGHAVLDVFAGSGALGIEALSRGAATCTFVEAAPPALRALGGNLERLGVEVVRAGGGEPGRPCAAARPLAVVLGTDVRRALAADSRRGARYTLVFADPPYDAYEQVRPALVRLLGRVLVPGAVLVVESAARTAAGLPWTIVREKRYGDTRVTFLVAGAGSSAEGEAAD
jgi:16S rRNA (guanine966-N2)-methyltransferase